MRHYENGCMNFAVDFCTANMKQKIFVVTDCDRKNPEEIYDGREERRNCSN